MDAPSNAPTPPPTRVKPSRMSSLSNLSLRNTGPSHGHAHFMTSGTHDACVDYVEGAGDTQVITRRIPSETTATAEVGVVVSGGGGGGDTAGKVMFVRGAGGLVDGTEITTVTVIDSGIVHTINHKNCQGKEGYARVVATLFYRPGSGGATTSTVEGTMILAPQDGIYGRFVSQPALFDFISTWDSLIVPYQKWDSSHRCLENAEEARVVELTLFMPEMLSLDELRRHEDIAAFEMRWSVEVVLQLDSVFRRTKRLVVFDMDSTLIEQEVIDEIARVLGVEKEVSVGRAPSLSVVMRGLMWRG